MAAKIKIRWAGRNQQDRRGASSAALRGQQKAAFKSGCQVFIRTTNGQQTGEIDAVFFQQEGACAQGPPAPPFLPKDAVRVKGGSISSSRCGGGLAVGLHLYHHHHLSIYLFTDSIYYSMLPPHPFQLSQGMPGGTSCA